MYRQTGNEIGRRDLGRPSPRAIAIDNHCPAGSSVLTGHDPVGHGFNSKGYIRKKRKHQGKCEKSGSGHGYSGLVLKYRNGAGDGGSEYARRRVRTCLFRFSKVPKVSFSAKFHVLSVTVNRSSAEILIHLWSRPDFYRHESRLTLQAPSLQASASLTSLSPIRRQSLATKVPCNGTKC